MWLKESYAGAIMRREDGYGTDLYRTPTGGWLLPFWGGRSPFHPLPNFSSPGRKVFSPPLYFFFFFFKSLLNLLQYGFYVSVFWPWGMWDLSSSSPDEPTGSALDVVLTTGPPGDIPPLLYSYTIFFAPHLEHFITVLLLLLKWSLCVDLSLLLWGPSDPWEPSNSYHKEVLYRCWMKWKPCSLIT